MNRPPPGSSSSAGRNDTRQEQRNREANRQGWEVRQQVGEHSHQGQQQGQNADFGPPPPPRYNVGAMDYSPYDAQAPRNPWTGEIVSHEPTQGQEARCGHAPFPSARDYYRAWNAYYHPYSVSHTEQGKTSVNQVPEQDEQAAYSSSPPSQQNHGLGIDLYPDATGGPCTEQRGTSTPEVTGYDSEPGSSEYDVWDREYQTDIKEEPAIQPGLPVRQPPYPRDGGFQPHIKDEPDARQNFPIGWIYEQNLLRKRRIYDPGDPRDISPRRVDDPLISDPGNWGTQPYIKEELDAQQSLSVRPPSDPRDGGFQPHLKDEPDA